MPIVPSEDPTYPQGTPEYETYAAKLGTELAKFALGEDPYPYRREEVAMPTVPNWIAKAYVYSAHPLSALPIKSWRATKTQVVVTYVDEYGVTRETRFRLADLTEIGREGRWSSRLRLCAPDDEQVLRALPQQAISKGVDLIRKASADLQTWGMTPEQGAERFARIRDAAAEALAGLAEYL
jgi:hypothetical protein